MDYFNRSEGRKAIKQVLKKTTFKSSRIWYIFIGVGLGLCLVGVAFFVWGFIQNTKTGFETPDPTFLNWRTIIGLIIILVGMVTTTISFILGARVTRKNSNRLAPYGKQLHSVYFEKALNSEMTNLSFTGFSPADQFMTPVMNFEYNGFKISWQADEDIEMRTTTSVDKNGQQITESHQVYFLKTLLETNVPALNGFALTRIQSGNATHFMNRNQYWQSESIDFNENYLVRSSNEWHLTKLFEPKIIDNFNRLTPRLDLKTIIINDGKCLIDYRGPESLTSYHPSVEDWDGIKWTKANLDVVIDKIESDFNRFIDNWIFIDAFAIDAIPLNRFEKTF